jgi:threonine aldolase
MSNLIGMMINVRIKGEGAILGHLSHIYCIERGGISALGSIHPIVVNNKADGTMDLKDIEAAIPPNIIHLSQPRVIALESSHNNCSGRVLTVDYINQVRKIADKHKLRMHLDGARGLNAATSLGVDPKVMVKDFDTVNFCLSKGMGCPVGSLIIGDQEHIDHARVVRKMLGGQMRQVGILATCGLISLEDWRERLQEDHDNCKWLSQELSRNSQIHVHDQANI